MHGRREGSEFMNGRTLTIPSIPQAAATISPQYLSLHHDMLHPPSAYQHMSTIVNTSERELHAPRVYRALDGQTVDSVVLAAAVRSPQGTQSSHRASRSSA